MSSEPFYPVATAAVSGVANGTPYLHVFATNGYVVKHRSYGPDGWTDGSFHQPGHHVSATAWVDGAGLRIRVYCTTKDAIAEWCQDAGGDWYPGQYTLA